jgi:hypothetical protein
MKGVFVPNRKHHAKKHLFRKAAARVHNISGLKKFEVIISSSFKFVHKSLRNNDKVYVKA